MGKLNSKVAVVTGASKGIGASIAKALASEGASVVVNYASDKAGAERVVSEITKAGGSARAVKGDVGKSADVKQIFSETEKSYGKVDVLVNNAGIYQFAALQDITEEQIQKMFNTNVTGLLLTTQEAVRHFSPNGGAIINISSTVTRVTPPTTAVYTGTKGAVDAITGVLAKELGPSKIRVNSINPGPVETEGLGTAGFLDSDFLKQAVAQTPLGRIAQPEDIASIAVFLASSDSAWLTGEVLLASGGLK